MKNALSIDVLDHGFVRLVDHMGSDVDISRAARVSFDSPARDMDDKLIRRLWRDKHTSPFESVQFTFEVKAPIFVFRQWHRHRTWAYNEVSARYTELPEEFYIPEPEKYGTQSKSNKQVRDLSFAGIDGYSQGEWDKFLRWEREQREQMESSFEMYRRHLSEGMPRELARAVLPLSTYSRMFGSVNLLNLLRFLTLRTAPDAQYEIRMYAEALRDLARTVTPVAVGAWDECRW